jgi:cytoskeletal protein RodZ
MRDPGLSFRLSQRSRRSGLMIGISMALAIAVLIATFAVIYAWLDPLTNDFVTKKPPTAVVAQQQRLQAQDTAGQAATRAPGAVAAPPTKAPTAAPSPTASTAPAITQSSPTSQAFKPDYQIRGDQGVNLRAQPSTDSDIVATLSPSTPIQYLNDRQPTDNPDQDGPYWMKFRTEDGESGWVRQIDVTQYSQ